ncbi:MAG: ROK family protein [Clostridiales bacterium]|nr:ROK family protein [Clostridiales bacterium]
MILGALEAGGTKMVCAIGDEKGVIIDKTIIKTTSPDETMPNIINFFKDKKIDAFGICSFGPIDLNRNSATYGYITTTPKLQWANYNIVGTIQEAFNVPIGFDTDVNGAALGEATYGCTRDVLSSIYITVGTGIGVGFYHDGSLLHGMLHPEAGHIMLKRHPLDHGKSVCSYHENCFEGLASGTSIEARWKRKAYELADEKLVWEIEAYYIAHAIINYIVTLMPHRIVLGGGVMHQKQLFPLIRSNVKSMLNGYIKTPEIQDIDNYIVPASLDDNQAILGCFKLAMMELYNTNSQIK